MYKLARKIKDLKEKESIPLKRLEKAKAILSRGCNKEAKALLRAITIEFENSRAAMLAEDLLSEIE